MAAAADASLDQTMFRRLFLSCFHTNSSKRKKKTSTKETSTSSSTLSSSSAASSSASSPYPAIKPSSLRSEVVSSGIGVGVGVGVADGSSSSNTILSLQQQKDQSQVEPTTATTATSAKQGQHQQQQRHTSSPPATIPTPQPPQPLNSSLSSIMPKVSKKAKSTPTSTAEPYAKPDKTSAASKAKSKLKSKYLSSSDSQNVGANAAKAASAKAANTEKLNLLFTDLVTDEDRETDGDGNTLGAESVAGYIASLGADPNTYESLVVHDILQAEELWRLTRTEFVNGWLRVNETNPEVTPDHAAHKKYVKQSSDKVAKDPAYFKKLYLYAFTAGTESVDGKRQKSMGMGTALGCWEALFDAKIGRAWKTASVNWLEVWQQFLAEKFLVGEKFTRTVSRDLWNQTLVFVNKTLEDETLGFWDEDQAWPGIIDDFALWCKEKGIVKVVNKDDGSGDIEIDE